MLIWINFGSNEAVNELYAQWESNGAKTLSVPESKPWALHEFTIKDLDENLIREFYDFQTPMEEESVCTVGATRRVSRNIFDSDPGCFAAWAASWSHCWNGYLGLGTDGLRSGRDQSRIVRALQDLSSRVKITQK